MNMIVIHVCRHNSFRFGIMFRLSAFLLPILVYWTLGSLAALPKWVHRVDSCPNPGNIRQWLEASKKLNCDHNLMSNEPKEQENVYHCLPSSFLNETVEFCGRNVPVEPGKCPVYSYQMSQNVAPTSFNCSKFSAGCPDKQYFSKNVYKYRECLSLNRQGRCFKAVSNCSSISQNDSDESKENLVESSLYFWLVPVVLLTVAVIITIVYFCLRRRKIEKPKEVGSEQEMETLNSPSDKDLTKVTVPILP